MMKMAIVLIFSLLGVVFSYAKEPIPYEQSVEQYALVLETFVDPQGMVNYAALASRKGRKPLDAYVKALGHVSEQVYKSWSEAGQIAFWINAYNAITLRVIIDHYPIKSSWVRSAVFPKNSIRQIDGAWTKKKFDVAGLNLSLDEIEHSILREDFREPRIHMALVCAARSCPYLRGEPYYADTLDEQLTQQSQVFLSLPTNFRIHSQKKIVYLSAIFDWFGKDFITEDLPMYNDKWSSAQQAVLRFIAPFARQEDVSFSLEKLTDYRIRYLPYDWALNEQNR